MDMIPFIEEVALTAVTLSGLGLGYTHVAKKIAKLEAEVHQLKDQSRVARLEAVGKEVGLENRIDSIEIQLTRIQTLLEDEVTHIRKLVERHQDKFDQYDVSIRLFWENYKLEKK